MKALHLKTQQIFFEELMGKVSFSNPFDVFFLCFVVVVVVDCVLFLWVFFVFVLGFFWCFFNVFSVGGFYSILEKAKLLTILKQDHNLILFDFLK